MTFLFRYTKSILHIHFRVFAGVDRDHLAYCGYVTMRDEEWQEYKALLENSPNVLFSEAESFVDDMDAIESGKF